MYVRVHLIEQGHVPDVLAGIHHARMRVCAVLLAIEGVVSRDIELYECRVGGMYLLVIFL